MPIGIDRREVQHVEAHLADARHLADHIDKRAVAIFIIAHGAREDFVPACKACGGAFGIDAIRHRIARQERPVPRRFNRLRRFRRERRM